MQCSVTIKKQQKDQIFDEYLIKFNNILLQTGKHNRSMSGRYSLIAVIHGELHHKL